MEARRKLNNALKTWRKHKYSTLEYYSQHTTNQPRTQQNVHILKISKLIFHVPFLQKLLGLGSRHEAVDQDGKEGAQDSNWDQAEKEASHKASGKNAIGGWGKPQNSWGFGKSSQNI